MFMILFDARLLLTPFLRDAIRAHKHEHELYIHLSLSSTGKSLRICHMASLHCFTLFFAVKSFYNYKKL